MSCGSFHLMRQIINFYTPVVDIFWCTCVQVFVYYNLFHTTKLSIYMHSNNPDSTTNSSWLCHFLSGSTCTSKCNSIGYYWFLETISHITVWQVSVYVYNMVQLSTLASIANSSTYTILFYSTHKNNYTLYNVVIFPSSISIGICPMVVRLMSPFLKISLPRLSWSLLRHSLM